LAYEPPNAFEETLFRESFEFHAFPVVKFVIGLFFGIKNPKSATVWELQNMFFFIHMGNECPCNRPTVLKSAPFSKSSFGLVSFSVSVQTHWNQFKACYGKNEFNHLGHSCRQNRRCR
jgi:hypothetical protein